MAFSFNSVGHFFASGLDELVKVNGKIEAFIARATAVQPEVEKLTSLIPIVGPPAVVVERGVYAIAGEVAGVLQKADPALKQHLLDAGLDQTALTAFEKLLIDIPSLWAGAASGLITPVSAPTA